MTNTPINPDALENAADIIWMRGNTEDGICDSDRERGSYKNAMSAANEAVSAYLAVAQPVVNSAEELNALPVGTHLADSDGEYLTVVSGAIACSDGQEYDAFSLQRSLPATVLYLPTN